MTSSSHIPQPGRILAQSERILPQPERILMVRPSALGDVCRTVPALVTLRRAYPEARIDWLVQDAFADAVIAHPALVPGSVVPFPRTRFSGWWRSAAVAREMAGWVRSLRAARYDAVYDLQGLSRSGLMTRVSGAPRRVGFHSVREFAWLGYNIRHPAPRSRHIVDQMLELLENEGLEPVRDMRLYTPPDARAWWCGWRGDAGADCRYAVLAPTSRWETKRWPTERWRDLIEPLRERGFDRLLLIGAPHERDQVAPLREPPHPAVIDLVGATTIAQTMAVIEAAGLVIANDSAPLHMAVGFDRPVVGLFGPTDPAFVGPYGRENAVIRIYDPDRDRRIHFRRGQRGSALMERITVEMVIERVDHVLSGGTDQRPIESSPARAREESLAG